VVIAIRQSPDWAALADDWNAGRAIDPARYAPPRPIPAFPEDIVDLIARWNAYAAIDFFSVRRRLKDIAQATLRRVERAIVLSCADVVVFPFVRLGREQTCTFATPPFLPPAAIGPMHPLPQRYNTNNYGLTPSMWRQRHLAAMQDHFDASAYGNRMRLVDRYRAEIVGATSKTPCAASFLPTVVQSRGAFTEAIRFYVRDVRRYLIPDALDWMREPLAATLALFDEVLARAAATTR